MKITKEQYLEAQKIVFNYRKQYELKPKKCFISGDKKSIIEGEKYFAVTFSNTEMTIVSNIEECVYGKSPEWEKEPYRCFSTLENANNYILEKGFSYKTES
jgi:hypothetical protein